MHLSHKFQPFFELLDPSTANPKIRYVILVGGRGGAKSHALGTWVNAATFNAGWGIYFTRWTMRSAEKSIIPQFKTICDSLGNTGSFQFKQTQVVNNQTGVTIDYSGLKPQSNQSSGDSKSLADKNILIVEEAEDVQGFELFDKADNSIRTINHQNFVILCLNQGHINHWIYKQFFTDKRDDTLIIETTYLDNIKYLNPGFIAKAEREKEKNYKRYRHIYLNDWKKDVDGALFEDADISKNRITSEQLESVNLKEICIGYDPAISDSAKPEKEKMKNTGNEPDEDGIIVAAKSDKGHYYVLDDKTARGKRSKIAEKICRLYHKYDCNYLVIEKNNGGDWISTLIKQTDRYVRCKMVTATRGKAVRAQPVQALYENNEVHHVGNFGELEMEMTTWIPDTGLPSPNRLDALVWALSYLSGKAKQSAPKVHVF